MIGHSGAPLEHLVHLAVCKTARMIAERLHVLEPTFFANGAEVGGVRERAPGSPTHPLAHRGAWRRRVGSTTSQLDLFWPANFRPIPQKDSAWDAYTAKETENRQGEVGFLRYSPYGP